METNIQLQHCPQVHIPAAVRRLAPVSSAAGDVVAFRGNQKHQYFNPTDGASVAYSVLAFAPIAS